MTNGIAGTRLEKKGGCTWPRTVKVIKVLSKEKGATKDLLSILEKLYQDKIIDYPPRRTRRE
jgi:hypothetical protein